MEEDTECERDVFVMYNLDVKRDEAERLGRIYARHRGN